MATRRPASSRARLNSNTNPMPPPQIPRSRSVMSKSASSSRSTDDQHKETPQISTTIRQQKNSDDAETNIQVVIRCRRRSEREIQDNSPIIISSNGAKSKEVSIETSAPVSSLGVVTLPPIRTYPFDLVFGPEADQALVYHDVVHPMLEEVLMGYNCTLFAYGQTGTGKTHTMQGDLTPTPMGNPSANAGMIPRVLFRLFHQLESSNSDYSVKVSFIELYNEELRDLLAEELSAPVGSTQPMGIASKDRNPDNGLKIFDDTTKRGVIIQGLEEVAVKDSKDALALLTKGSDRRQIAATKFNDHSSRSHSVFSITVHIKESSTMGDDLLKIGKLNLVDLAGSENIGRSGAENKRAREAGMINQSLLTLGRVINALVDKAQHVPYRESKLTRLLQDSLGGRTKTCIIATISPARSNMEETLSTLDYAMRAKSIRNKPELNQRMTRNSLLKEYVAEIERLKADLLAAREKNGIFFSEETWNQLNAEQELKQTELQEARKQVEIVESQMRAVREEFEQSIALLMKTDGELRITKKKLSDTEEDLVEKEGQLKLTKEALEEEVVVRKAHQATEIVLDDIATGLKNVAADSVRDVGGLFDKLDRKAKVLGSNTRVVLDNGGTISNSVTALSQQLGEFNTYASQTMSKLQSEVKEFEVTELKALSAQSDRIEQRLGHIQKSLGLIQEKDSLESEALDVTQSILREAQETLKVEVAAWGEDLKKTCSRLCSNVLLANNKQATHMEKALNNMGSLAETIMHETYEYVGAERDALLEAKSLVDTATSREIAHLQNQNATLIKILATERQKADAAKDELIQRVSGLLGEFTQERDVRLKEAIQLVQTQNNEAGSMMQTFSRSHTELIENMERSGTAVSAKFESSSGEGKRTRDGVIKILKNAHETLRSDMKSIDTTLSSSVDSHSAWVDEQTQLTTNSYSDAFEENSRAKRARIEITTSLEKDVRTDYAFFQSEIKSSMRNVVSSIDRISKDASGLRSHTGKYHDTASGYLQSIHQAANTLTRKGAREDTPTGATPRKRDWSYVDHWELTGSREDVLQSWKGHGESSRDTHAAEFQAFPAFPEEDDSQAILEPVEPSRSPSPEVVAPLEPLVADLKPKVVELKGKSDVPAAGTLVDSRKRNVYTTRASRRAR